MSLEDVLFCELSQVQIDKLHMTTLLEVREIGDIGQRIQSHRRNQ